MGLGKNDNGTGHCEEVGDLGFGATYLWIETSPLPRSVSVFTSSLANASDLTGSLKRSKDSPMHSVPSKMLGI